MTSISMDAKSIGYAVRSSARLRFRERYSKRLSGCGQRCEIQRLLRRLRRSTRRDQRSEVRGQRSEVRSQRSEVSQTTNVRNLKRKLIERLEYPLTSDL